MIAHAELVMKDTFVVKLASSAHLRYFCENSMIAHAELVMKDTFAPQFASIQWILRLAKDHWREFSTRNAHMVHIVN